MCKKGVNKYGIKLEDYSNYSDYKKAINNAKCKAYSKTEKGRLAKYKGNAKYLKSEKGKISVLKYNQSKKCKLTLKKYAAGIGKAGKNATVAKRRAAKLQRTPAWADLEAIKQFYLNCPKGYHVDHDVPLQGENISGLHVLNNLVYLTAEDNLKKSNKWPHNYSAQNGFSSNLAIV